MKKTYLIALMSILLISLSSTGWSQEPPYIAPISDKSTLVGELFTLDVDAENANPAETYELLESRPGMTIDPVTGLIEWTPNQPDEGGKVTVRAYNSAGESERSFFVYLSDAIVCSSDLISYWKMDEATGDTIADFQGGYTARSLNPISPVQGVVDGAQLFEPVGATDQFVYVTDEDQYEFDRSESFSISLWFKFNGNHLTEDENQVLLARGNPEGDNMSIILMLDLTTYTSPRVSFSLRPKNGSFKTVTPNIDINQNTWYHVVAIYHGSNNPNPTDLSVYVDNQRNYYTHTFSDKDFVGTQDLNIGFWDVYETNRFPFNGSIDEVLIYRKALSQTEVGDIYNDGLGGTPHCKPGNYYPLITSTPVETAAEDSEYSYTLTADDFEGEPLTLSAEVLPSWLSFDPATGLVSGTPGNENVGDTLVKLKVTDGSIDLFQEYTLTVTNVNDPPEITSTPSVTTIDQGETFSYTMEATDVDEGDEVTLSAPGLPSWMTFDPATGVLEGTPSNDQVQYSVDSTFDISLEATDKSSESVTQEFTLTVINVNDLPEVVSQADVSIDRNSSVDISLGDLTVNDPDDFYPSSHQLIVFAGDDYTFDGSTISPAENFYGDLVVNIGISDGIDTLNYGFQVTVNFVNIAPEFTSNPKLTASEGSAYSYALTVEDPDIDDPNVSQELTFTAVILPSWLELDAETNILVGIPTRDDIGENDVSIKVSDGVEEVFQNFTIDVKSTNNVPVINSTPPQQVNNYAEYSYTISASDADASDELTYSATLIPAWLSFDPATQVLSGIPEKNDVGAHDVTLAVTDGYDEVEQSFTITVLDVNTAPVVTSEPLDSVLTGSTYTYLMEVTDYENDPLTITETLVPEWLTFDVGSRVLQGTPTNDNVGEHTVIITVSDGVFTINHQFKIRVIRKYPEGINDLEGSFTTNVYPNPASEFVVFELKGDREFNLEISDITGKVVIKEQVGKNVSKYQVDLSELDKGIYIYRLYDGESNQSGKFMIK